MLRQLLLTILLCAVLLTFLGLTAPLVALALSSILLRSLLP